MIGLPAWYVGVYIALVVVAFVAALCIWLDWRQWRSEREQARWNATHRPQLFDAHRLDPEDVESSVRVLRSPRL